MSRQRLLVLLSLAIGTLLTPGCAASKAPASTLQRQRTSEIGSRIKLLARYHSGSTVVSGNAISYYVYSLKPPRGYRSVITFTEGPTEQRITVQLYEYVQG